jgi:hypothetical protein
MMDGKALQLVDLARNLESSVDGGKQFEMRRRWVVWWLYVGIWTWALLLPNPDRWVRALILPDTVAAGEGHPVREKLLHVVSSFVFSKTLHVTGYALLAIVSGWQRVSGRYRWGLLGFMSLHALATEFLQTYAPGRHPSSRDVSLDHLGIALGVAVSWKWWLDRTR